MPGSNSSGESSRRWTCWRDHATGTIVFWPSRCSMAYVPRKEYTRRAFERPRLPSLEAFPPCQTYRKAFDHTSESGSQSGRSSNLILPCSDASCSNSIERQTVLIHLWQYILVRCFRTPSVARTAVRKDPNIRCTLMEMSVPSSLVKSWIRKLSTPRWPSICTYDSAPHHRHLDENK